jgi:hypothetical protein
VVSTGRCRHTPVVLLPTSSLAWRRDTGWRRELSFRRKRHRARSQSGAGPMSARPREAPPLSEKAPAAASRWSTTGPPVDRVTDERIRSQSPPSPPKPGPPGPPGPAIGTAAILLVFSQARPAPVCLRTGAGLPKNRGHPRRRRAERATTVVGVATLPAPGFWPGGPGSGPGFFRNRGRPRSSNTQVKTARYTNGALGRPRWPRFSGG